MRGQLPFLCRQGDYQPLRCNGEVTYSSQSQRLRCTPARRVAVRRPRQEAACGFLPSPSAKHSGRRAGVLGRRLKVSRAVEKKAYLTRGDSSAARHIAQRKSMSVKVKKGCLLWKQPALFI